MRERDKRNPHSSCSIPNLVLFLLFGWYVIYEKLSFFFFFVCVCVFAFFFFWHFIMCFPHPRLWLQWVCLQRSLSSK